MSSFQIPERVLRDGGLTWIEWPPGSDRRALYDKGERDLMASLRVTLETEHAEHTAGCKTTSVRDHSTLDLSCGHCATWNEIALLHEAKVEFGSTIRESYPEEQLEIAEGGGPAAEVADLPPLSDPAANAPGKRHADAGPTEKKAAWKVMPRSGTQRFLILQHVACAGEHGMTDEEIMVAPGVADTAHRTRRRELVEGGWLRDSGRTRTTRSETDSIVWTLSERGQGEIGKLVG